MNEPDGTAVQAVKVLLVLGQLAAVGWMMTPAHKRRYILMHLVEGSRRLLSGLARRSGHISMGTELRTGQQEYRLTSAISLSRDQMAVIYERLRTN